MEPSLVALLLHVGPVGRQSRVEALFDAGNAAGSHRETEFVGRARVAGDAVSAKVRSHSTLHLDNGLIHLNIVGKVGLSAERSALRQSHNEALGVVGAIGSRTDNERCAKSGRSSPFDVGVALHCGDFRSHSTHDVSAHPTFATGVLQADSLFNSPRVRLDAAEVGREVDAVVDAAQEQLPSAVAGVRAVVAEDAHHRAVAQRKQIVLESRVVAGAHHNRVAAGIFDGAVGGGVAGDESVFAIGVREFHVVEAHQLALPLAQAGSVGRQSGDGGRNGVDFSRSRQAVEFGVVLEGFERQESGFPHAAFLVVFGIAQLLQRVVLAHPDVLERNHHLLTDAIGVVEAVAVERD